MTHGPHMTWRTAVIDDLRRDWRRWTTAERVSASAIVAVLLVSIPAAILVVAMPTFVGGCFTTTEKDEGSSEVRTHVVTIVPFAN